MRAYLTADLVEMDYEESEYFAHMRTKKTPILAAAGALLGSLALPGIALADVKDPPPPKPTSCLDGPPLALPKNPDKVTLCHFTGSGSNPFVTNEVSQSGADSHLLNPDHHGDCGRYGSGLLVCVQ